MTADQRTAYYKAKDKLLEEGKLKSGKPVFPESYGDNKTTTKTQAKPGEGKSKSARNRRNLKAKIQQLESAVTGGNEPSPTPSDTPSSKQNAPSTSTAFSETTIVKK